MTVPALDIAAAPLEHTTLVEAAAGTGKTWTIAALYVRLLLERRLRAEDILVLTFARAATAELKTRIRARLAELRAALDAGALAALRESDDALFAHVSRTTREPRHDALWLALAIESLDQAPIHTIHAFCQRVLAEHAFESGAPFLSELAPDESALVRSVAQDFWRNEIAAASPLWALWLARTGATPTALAHDIAFFAQRPYARVIGPERDDAAAVAEFEGAHAAARALWFAQRGKLASLYCAIWKRADWCESRPRAMDALLAPEAGFPEDPAKIAPIVQFTRAKLGANPPDHPFLDAAERLWASIPFARTALGERHTAMRVRLAAVARETLPLRKRERGLVGYGDLVIDLCRALRSSRGAALASALRSRYPAALLDEFQDTDPVQAEIFERIYGGTAAAVYLVGDPKQAIYGFRGADIHAYLDARARAATQRTLLTNRRSIPAQVSAVNAVFGGAAPFLTPDIAFAACAPGPQPQAPIVIEHDWPAPFTVWFMPPEAGKSATKGEATRRFAGATAASIARLLAPGAATLDGTPLAGSDVAVLVGTHRQGAAVRRALAALGVPSVTHGQDSVFAAPAAVDIERVLLAVAEPGRESLVRAALATDLLGWTGDALARLADDARGWDAVLERFARYRDRAVAHGFIRMWRELIEAEGVPARLLQYADGERRLTDVQHLSDLLQEAAVRDGLDLEGLARLLDRAREHADADADAALLRLESDERLVRILTVHAAKGLEFPVVFCPFLWDGAIRAAKSDLAACHGPAGALIDTGSSAMAIHRTAAEEEERAERLRLAYVALTRAKHRCIVAWGAVKEAGSSPLAWLLHGHRDGDLAALGEARLRADLDVLVERSGGAIAIVAPPDAPGVRLHAAAAGQKLQARRFAGTLPAPWRVSSFSGLVARRPGLERPDHDSIAVPPAAFESGDAAVPVAERTLFSFPRGMQPGTLIHALFEHVDFERAAAPAAHGLVAALAAEHGVDRAWAGVLQRMLVDVLTTPLDADGRLLLGSIGARERIAELEFLFPVAGGEVALAPGMAPPAGFMKGYIDLVFTFEDRWYVVDWKSNWLGDDYADYTPDRLAAAMRAAQYDLQYRLYALAVHRHLAARLPGYAYDTHFGGVYYLFVRGMRPAGAAATGVFFARPERAAIDELSARFADATLRR